MDRFKAAVLTGTLLLGGAGGATASSVFGAETIPVAEANAAQQAILDDKQLILEDNIYLRVRLGELPAWDPSIVTAQEMTTAYTDLATKKDALDNENLYDGLRLQAQEAGAICK